MRTVMLNSILFGCLGEYISSLGHTGKTLAFWIIFALALGITINTTFSD